MIKICFLFATILLFSNCYSSNSRQNVIKNNSKYLVSSDSTAPKTSINDFVGEWDWTSDDDNNDFSVSIKIKKDNELVGSYCAVMQQGLKMDCSDNNAPSFIAIFNGGDNFTTNFTSYYSNSKGKVKISLKNGQLIWDIIDQPKGEFYAPINATLIKKRKAK